MAPSLLLIFPTFFSKSVSGLEICGKECKFFSVSERELNFSEGEEEEEEEEEEGGKEKGIRGDSLHFKNDYYYLSERDDQLYYQDIQNSSSLQNNYSPPQKKHFSRFWRKLGILSQRKPYNFLFIFLVIG